MQNMFRILAFLALAGFTWAQTCVLGTNCFNGTCQNDFCACGSGFSNLDNCQAATSICPGQWATLDELITDNPPILDTAASGIHLGNLTIRLTTNLVIDRLSTFIYLEDPALYPACALGAWAKSFLDTPDCTEQYDLDLPWMDAVNCGFVEDLTTPGFAYYRNNLYVQHKDLVSNFRGTPVYRDTIHAFPVEIKVKTSVEVCTYLTVYAPVNLLAAITRQTYNLTTDQGIIEFTTSLQWPFELSDAHLNGHPVQLSVILGSAAIDCAATVGAACAQKYTLTITPDLACSLSGDYRLDFTLVCRGSPSDCPLDLATSNVTIIGEVNSENFCAGLYIDIGLTGDLQVYADNAFSVVKHDFLQGQVAYFQATLSTANTAIIMDSEIIEIRITDGITTRLLRQLSSSTLDGISVGLVDMMASTPSQPAFQLSPNNNVFVVDIDASVQFTVWAVIDVSYTGNLKKRFVVKREIQPGTQNSQPSAVVTVAGPSSNSAAASASSSHRSNDFEIWVDSSSTLSCLALALALF